MRPACDAVIIGGGHNGLVCAFYLARAGLKSARARTPRHRRRRGGDRGIPSRLPTASYTVSLLNPKVIADMKLAERGLRILERPLSNFLPDGGYLKLGGGWSATQFIPPLLGP